MLPPRDVTGEIIKVRRHGAVEVQGDDDEKSEEEDLQDEAADNDVGSGFGG